AEDGIRYFHVTGVQTCALPIYSHVIPSEFSAGCDPEDTNPSQSTFSFPLKTNFSLLFRLYRAATAYGFFLQICRPYGASRSTQCYYCPRNIPVSLQNPPFGESRSNFLRPDVRIILEMI